MILADMSNGNEANRKRTADGMYSDDHSSSVGGSESLTTDGNKKMKTDYSSLGNGADTELSAPSIAVEQVENVEPDSGVSGPLLKPPRKLARSPSPTKSARSVSPMRSPAKAEQESCKSSPVRMEVSLDTPEINSMSKSASPLRQSQPPKSPVRLAAPTEPQPKPIVMQSAAGSEENTEEEGGEEKLSGQDSAALDSEPATPSMAGSVSMEESGGVDELHKAQFKWAGNSLRSLKRCNDIPPFLQPVDPLALGIPDYFNVIKNPMDISTIDKRLQSRSYSTVQDYIADVRLMLNNCFTYNPVGHPVYAMGKSVEKVFEATIKRMPLQLSDIKKPEPKPSHRLSLSASPSGINRPKREVHQTAVVYPILDGPKRKKGKSKPDDLKWCYNVFNELMKKKHEMFMFVFYKPVDPVALNIPQYFDVIKEPMDLSTMKKKLDAGEYETADEFEADFRLMVRNCYTFNRPGDDVYLMGQRAEEVFDHKWAEKMVFLAKAATTHQTAAGKAVKKRKSIAGSKGAMGRPSLSGLNNESSSDEEDDVTKSSQLQQMIQQQLLLLQELSKQKKSKKSSNGKKSGGDSRRTSKVSMGGESSVGGSVESLYSGDVAGGLAAAATGGAVPPKPAAPRPKAPSQPKKKKKDEIREISFEEKKELSEAINTLSGDKLGRVVQIIHESMPQLQGESGQEEIELDIDSLDLITLNKLWNFVKGSANRRKPKGAVEAANQAASAARIHELEMELARLEGRSDKTKLLQDNAEILNGGSGQQSVNESESSDSEEGSDGELEDNSNNATPAPAPPAVTSNDD